MFTSVKIPYVADTSADEGASYLPYGIFVGYFYRRRSRRVLFEFSRKAVRETRTAFLKSVWKGKEVSQGGGCRPFGKEVERKVCIYNLLDGFLFLIAL